VAHGRTYFVPRYDGTDRWLQRVYLSTGLFTTDENKHIVRVFNPA